MIRSLGIDPSYTSMGLAWRDSEDSYMTLAIHSAAELSNPERQDFLLSRILDVMDSEDIGFVAIEGYAFGMRQQATRAHMAGELSGIIKYTLWQIGTPVMVVPPRNLKQFATGNGNAAKQMVRQSVINYWGYYANTDDEADAYVLLRMAEASQSGRIRHKIGEPRTKALKKCEIFSPKT